MRSFLIGNGSLLVLLAALWAPVPQAAAEGAHHHVSERSKAAGMEHCVAPTDVMRRYHMEFLKHQRDETVRGGIRGAKYSLAQCVDCHASADEQGNPVPINGEGEFCQRCHAYVAVELPCFQCHRTTPEAGKGANLGHRAGEGEGVPLAQSRPDGRRRD